MAIDMLSDRAMKTMPETTGGILSPKGDVKAAASSSAASQTARADAVEFTAEAKTLSRATQKARAADGMDHEKIDALRQALADGSYSVNYQSVANKLVDTEDAISSIFA